MVELEMPRFAPVNTVRALKIFAIGDDAEGHPFLEPEDGRFGRIHVTHSYVAKHSPQPGGWYVLHDDGYASFAPERVFNANFAAV